MTAGTKTAESVCGKEYSAYVITLTRGACVHWAHPNSASYLIPRACRSMKEKYGFHVFVAYSDTEAGEVGTVYQASNWLYCGQTNGASSMFVWPGRPDPARGVFYDGKPRDEQNIFKATRTRTSPGRPYHVHCSRREKHRELIRAGFAFYRTKPKHRYVTLCGSTEVVQELRAALRWKVSPYPRRTEGA